MGKGTCPFPRLHGQLVSLAEKMQSSYEKLGEQITELKLDHRDGKRESDRLTELLGGHMDCYTIFWCEQCWIHIYIYIYIYIIKPPVAILLQGEPIGVRYVLGLAMYLLAFIWMAWSIIMMILKIGSVNLLNTTGRHACQRESNIKNQNNQSIVMPCWHAWVRSTGLVMQASISSGPKTCGVVPGQVWSSLMWQFLFFENIHYSNNMCVYIYIYIYMHSKHGGQISW